jgi:hypothetical protein
VKTVNWDVLCLDLDGTLLCKQGEVSDQNLYALDRVRESGIETIIATGRSYAECKHILKKIHHTGVCITAGGSQLTNHDGESITRNVVDRTVVCDVTAQVVQQNLRCLLLKDATVCEAQYVLVGDAPLHSASKWWFESLGISVHSVPTIEDDPWPSHTLRVGAVAHEKDISTVAKQLEIDLDGRAKLQHWSAVTSAESTGSSTHLLEVFGFSVNKWSMLEFHLGKTITDLRIAAIGDGLNDIEVLREAHLSIAMENATDDVQLHANVIAGHHDNHGFAEAMSRWIIPRPLPS